MLVRRNGKAFFSSNSQRWGFDGFFSEIAMSGGASNHFDKISAGENPLKFNCGAAVRLFQTQPDDKRRGLYKDGYMISWKPEIDSQLYWYCIRREKSKVTGQNEIVSVGYAKDLGGATGVGSNSKTAIDMAYKAADNVAFTGLYYRPELDFVSRMYPTSIPNRVEFILKSGLL
jgi:hypothetical protein